MTGFLMIETQEGVTWPDWLALARRAEAAGLDGLTVSDHYLSMTDESRVALDAWAVLAALATQTARIALGTLVSPATFRPPAVLARNALTVDAVSGGRVRVGLGAGWFEREHEVNGFPFLDLQGRLALIEQQAPILRRTLDALGERRGRPRIPLVLGGAARPRMARLAAALADEYNAVFVDPAFCAGARRRLDEACVAAGRDPASLPLTLMTRAVVGRDEAEVRDRLARVAEREGALEPPEERVAWLVGTPEQVLARIAAYAAAGVVGYRFQHIDHTDLEMIDLLGEVVAELRSAP